MSYYILFVLVCFSFKLVENFSISDGEFLSESDSPFRLSIVNNNSSERRFRYVRNIAEPINKFTNESQQSYIGKYKPTDPEKFSDDNKIVTRHVRNLIAAALEKNIDGNTEYGNFTNKNDKNTIESESFDPRSLLEDNNTASRHVRSVPIFDGNIDQSEIFVSPFSLQESLNVKKLNSRYVRSIPETDGGEVIESKLFSSPASEINDFIESEILNSQEPFNASKLNSRRVRSLPEAGEDGTPESETFGSQESLENIRTDQIEIRNSQEPNDRAPETEILNPQESLNIGEMDSRYVGSLPETEKHGAIETDVFNSVESFDTGIGKSRRIRNVLESDQSFAESEILNRRKLYNNYKSNSRYVRNAPELEGVDDIESKILNSKKSLNSDRINSRFVRNVPELEGSHVTELTILNHKKLFNNNKIKSRYVRSLPETEVGIIELEQLDPQQESISSSYSIVQTSNGPNRLYTKKIGDVFEDEGPVLKIENNKKIPTNGIGKNLDLSASSKVKYLDEPGLSRSFEEYKVQPKRKTIDKFDISEKVDEVIPKTEKKTKTSTKPKSEKKKSQLPPRKDEIGEEIAASEKRPNNIADIVEDIKSEPQKSEEDLKKSASLLGGFHHGHGHGYDKGYDKDKHYEKEGGKKYKEARQGEEGEDQHNKYLKEGGYDKGQHEKKGKEIKEAVVSEKEGEKKELSEKVKEVGAEFEGEKKERDKAVITKGGHKKGRKKSGFHKVHHKDEYKKDEVFYDDNHDLDEREEVQHENEKHGHKKGAKEEKKVLDSGYHEGHGAKKGTQKKGETYEEAEGHKKEAKKEGLQKEHTEYDKKEGAKEGKLYGHEDKGKEEEGYQDDDF